MSVSWYLAFATDGWFGGQCDAQGILYHGKRCFFSHACFSFGTVCPVGTSSADLCQNVSAVISVVLVNENSPSSVITAFEAALTQAIDEGRLQSDLFSVNPSSSAFIIPTTSVMTPTLAPGVASSSLSTTPSSSSSLSTGATAGVVIAGIAFAFIVIGMVLFQVLQRGKRRGGSADSSKHYDYAPVVSPTSNIPVKSDGQDEENLGLENADTLVSSQDDDVYMNAPAMDIMMASDGAVRAGSRGRSSKSAVNKEKTQSIDDLVKSIDDSGKTLKSKKVEPTIITAPKGGRAEDAVLRAIGANDSNRVRQTLRPPSMDEEDEMAKPRIDTYQTGDSFHLNTQQVTDAMALAESKDSGDLPPPDTFSDDSSLDDSSSSSSGSRENDSLDSKNNGAFPVVPHSLNTAGVSSSAPGKEISTVRYVYFFLLPFSCFLLCFTF